MHVRPSQHSHSTTLLTSACDPPPCMSCRWMTEGGGFVGVVCAVVCVLTHVPPPAPPHPRPLTC